MATKNKAAGTKRGTTGKTRASSKKKTTARSRRSSSKKAASPSKKPGLYANIHAKQERIKRGSGEKMRKPGNKGAPTKQAFQKAARSVKKKAK